jgi:hypothetical protein
LRGRQRSSGGYLTRTEVGAVAIDRDDCSLLVALVLGSGRWKVSI